MQKILSAKVSLCSRSSHATCTFLMEIQQRILMFFSAGEVVSVPLVHSIRSIWTLPFGLLLQDVPEASSSVHIPFSSPSAPLSARDIARPKAGYNTQNNSTPTHAFDFIRKGDGTSVSSHLILKDPLEEPQACRTFFLFITYSFICIY